MSIETRPHRPHVVFGDDDDEANLDSKVIRLAPWTFTVDDYHRMALAGILMEDDRVELIEGEIVEMSPIGGPHMTCVNFLNRFLVGLLGDRLVVSIQNPIRLGKHSEPQPDVVLLRPHYGSNGRIVPGPQDVVVVIEVSDTTLRYDRLVKLPLYAAAGIPEAWIVDLQAEAVERYTEPVEGKYTEIARSTRGERLESRVVADVSLVVDDVLRL